VKKAPRKHIKTTQAYRASMRGKSAAVAPIAARLSTTAW
jgi:hypothetical protein